MNGNIFEPSVLLGRMSVGKAICRLALIFLILSNERCLSIPLKRYPGVMARLQRRDFDFREPWNRE
jgi:hypothetical protein